MTDSREQASEPVDLRSLEQPERFVASSKMRAVIRAEIKQFTWGVIAPGIAEAMSELVAECESRCTAKLNAMETKLAFLEQRSAAKATAPKKRNGSSSVAPEPPPAQRRIARSHR